MKKKIVSMLLVGLMALSLAACGGSDKLPANTGSITSENVKEEVKAPVDLSGIWKSDESDGTWIEATIEGEVISINWVSDNGDTKSIYWIGTYVPATEYTDDYCWTSDRDKEKTDTALLASTDDTKEFSYSNNEITYEASMMGTTKKIHLAKTE